VSRSDGRGVKTPCVLTKFILLTFFFLKEKSYKKEAKSLTPALPACADSTYQLRPQTIACKHAQLERREASSDFYKNA
jgi:hypothetical protein